MHLTRKREAAICFLEVQGSLSLMARFTFINSKDLSRVRDLSALGKEGSLGLRCILLIRDTAMEAEGVKHDLRVLREREAQQCRSLGGSSVGADQGL